MTHKQKQAQICPLCLGQNSCAVTLGKELEACWCNHTSFPAKEAVKGEALEPKACICQSCVAKLKEEAELGLKRLD
ncbi:cysteine-rich CWC family protein [uncultured Shewanella sp.]|uniref:cysteine-rich CWC family protein n=1 Tax=uncultured Shewanella sp. TaxID=173975 RepID=UPI002639B084|nr:cysteine-rich CWC family protein [uncultured Shewanella sp.]